MRAAKRPNGGAEETSKRAPNHSSASASASHRTRSQADPDWTTMDSLILVIEIAAVEKECIKQLSSYQRWKLVAENCTALEVVRTSNQCHRQWDLLVSEYNVIKQCEAQLMSDSYWSMGTERRALLGLPPDFDNELFDTIDDLVKTQQERLNTDSDYDTETEAEIFDVASEYGSKKQKKRLMSPISNVIEDGNKEEEEEEEDDEEEETDMEEKEGIMSVKLQNNVDEDEDEDETSMEEKEVMMAAKVREKVKLIDAVLKGKVTDEMDCKLSELKNIEATQVDFTRRQGDMLIACFGCLADTLSQLSDLVQHQK